MDLKNLHRITSATLENGMQIYVNRREPAPVVSVQAWVRTGSVHEEEYLGCGLSHFLEHMLFHGSSRYPGGAISDTVHRLGGDMNAFTSLDHTVYYFDLPVEHVGVAIDMLADMIINPLFPEDKFEDEKNIILRERDMHGDNPSRVLSEKIWHDSFTVHPARHPIIGYRNLIESVDRRMMVDYHRRRYSPERTFFIVSGLVDPDEVTAAISERTAGWLRCDLREPYLAAEPTQVCRRDSNYYYQDPLVRHGLVWPLPSGGHPDIPAIDVFCSILGQNRSSRLVKSLKVERQLALNIGSFSYTPSFCGIFGITALSSPERSEQMEEELLRELAAVGNDGFTRNEVEREVVQLTTEYLRTMRSNSAIVKVLGNCILSYGTPDFVDRYLEELRKLTPDDISRVAKEYLRPERLSLIRIMPPEQRGKLFLPPVPAAMATAGTVPELETLPGGQRLVNCFDASLPLIDLAVIMSGGTFFENRANAGVSQLIAALLPAGAGRFSEMDILQAFDDNGIDFSVSPGNNSLVFRLNCHRERLPQAMELMRAMLTAPHFDADAFSREQQIAVERLRSRQESPQNLADDKLLEVMYGDHPYALPHYGSTDSIQSLDPDAVRSFYQNICLRPEQMVFGAAGDFDPAEIKTFFTTLAGELSWRGGPEQPVAVPRFPAVPIRSDIANARSQAVVILALPGCDNLVPERYAVDLLQAAMNGQGSQLFRKVRDESGMAYYTGMNTSRGFHCGYLSLYAGTSAEHAEEVIVMLEDEVRRLAANGLDEEEFLAGRASLDHAEAEQLENSGSMMLQSCLSEYYGNGYLAPFRQREIYRALTLDEVNAMVKRLFAQPGPVSVVCRPGKDVE